MISEQTFTVQGGTAMVLKFAGSAGGSKLAFEDGAENLSVSYAGSIDGINFEWLTQDFMQKWQASNEDLFLRIDCTRMPRDKQIELSNFDIDVDEFTVEQASLDKKHGYYVTSRALDQEALKHVVEVAHKEMSRAAEDNAAWDILYYRSTLVKNINVLSNYELKAIRGTNAVRTMPVLFPHVKVLGTLDFDQFGLKYNELTNIHILAETFHSIYDDELGRPAKCDIIYIDFMDQYFEITDVEDVKTPTNEVLYYDCKMSVITDRKNVAKDTDLLDLTSLVDGNNQPQVQAIGKTEPVIVDFPQKTWSLQIFSKAQEVDLDANGNFYYGICYDQDAEQWRRFAIADNHIVYCSLKGELIEEQDFEDVIQLYVAKMAEFDQELNSYDATMYYTSYNFPRTLQPLNLVELQGSTLRQ